jgi:hypothetical protein
MLCAELEMSACLSSGLAGRRALETPISVGTMRSKSAQRYDSASLAFVSLLKDCSTWSSALNCSAAFFCVSCTPPPARRVRQRPQGSRSTSLQSCSCETGSGKQSDERHLERPHYDHRRASGGHDAQLDLRLDLRLSQHLCASSIVILTVCAQPGAHLAPANKQRTLGSMMKL